MDVTFSEGNHFSMLSPGAAHKQPNDFQNFSFCFFKNTKVSFESLKRWEPHLGCFNFLTAIQISF